MGDSGEGYWSWSGLRRLGLLLRCLWVRKKLCGPGDRPGHEGQRGLRLGVQQYGWPHEGTWQSPRSPLLPRLALNQAISQPFLNRGKWRGASTVLKPFGTCQRDSKAVIGPLFTASWLSPFLQTGSPLPSGDSSHFLSTDYVPGLVLCMSFLHCPPPQEAGTMTWFY